MLGITQTFQSTSISSIVALGPQRPPMTPQRMYIWLSDECLCWPYDFAFAASLNILQHLKGVLYPKDFIGPNLDQILTLTHVCHDPIRTLLNVYKAPVVPRLTMTLTE